MVYPAARDDRRRDPAGGTAASRGRERNGTGDEADPAKPGASPRHGGDHPGGTDLALYPATSFGPEQTAMKHLPRLSALLAAVLCAGVGQASTAIITVNSTADIDDANPGDGICQTATPGECTLRAAIQQATHSIEHDAAVTGASIEFNIPDSDPGRITGTDPGSGLAYEYYRIEVTQPLPAISQPNVVIDATTQIAVNPLGHPAVLLRGAGSAAVQGSGGLRVMRSFSTVRGFALQGFGRALAITPSGGDTEQVRLERNWVGIPLPGSSSGHGNIEGIVVAPTGGASVTRTTLGGTALGDGNWVGGNSAGGIIIYGRSGNNAANEVSQFNVFGNRVGLDPLSGAALGNGGAGLYIRHAVVALGGLTSERANVIAGGVPGSLLIQTAVGAPESIPIEGVGVYWDAGGGGNMSGNLIGTRPTGDLARPNASDGVRVARTAGSLSIGGAVAGSANLISGNGGHGIAVINVPSGTVSPGIVIDGNRIGVTLAGSSAMPNQGAGIAAGTFFSAPPLRIGSATAGNVIAGNLGDGIRIQSTRLSGVEVLGNRIGLGVDGGTAIPNQQYGLALSVPGDAGMPEPAARIEGNTIAANAAGGILVTQPGIWVLIEMCGNRIGVAADGITPRGNQGAGLRLQNASTVTNGGRLLQPADCAEANLFAHNAGPGVVMAANAGNMIASFSGMRFRDNDLGENALAIDLGDDGPTPNDPGDADSGPNRLQNFPDLGAVVLSDAGTTLSVSFRVDNFFSDFHPMTVDFYLDDGQGQGLDHIGTSSVLAAEIQQLKTVLLDADPGWAGRGLVAIATDALGRSSEFSRPRVVIDSVPKHTLFVSRSGAGSGTVASDPVGIHCGTDCIASFAADSTVQLDATPASGSVFNFWQGACVGNMPSCALPMTQDRLVTANFVPDEPASHQVTVELSGQGSVGSTPGGIDCPGSCAADFAQGTTLSLAATAASGWAFDRWQGCPTTVTANPCSFSVTGPDVVTAVFVQLPTEVLVMFSGDGIGTVISIPAGIDCRSDAGVACGHVFDPGQSASLSAAPDPGSVFAGWGGDCAGTSTCVLAAGGSYAVTASFQVEGAPGEEAIFADGFEDSMP